MNAKNSDGWTALIMASQEGHITVVQALLKKGADVNAGKTKATNIGNGQTAVFKAVSTHNLEIAKLLLKAGADPNVMVTVSAFDVMSDSEKSGMFVHSNKNPDAVLDVDKIINNTVKNINEKKTKKLKISPLEFAKKKGYTDMVTLLKQYGAK